MDTYIFRNTRVGVGAVGVLIIVIAAMLSVASYAASSGSSTLVISPPDSVSGNAVDIEAVSVTYTGIKGKGKKTEGVVLSKFNLATGVDSDELLVFFLWTDSDQASGALLNPNAFLETGIYYLDSDQQSADGVGYSGNCDADSQRSFDDGGTKYACPDTGDLASKALSRSNTAAVFVPTVIGKNVLYILADINVPGGAPSGQESLINELTFNIEVRKI